MATFGDRLKALRTARGLSQQELADKLGVNKMTISGYERNVRRPAGENALEIYEALADLFNVDLSYLLGHTDVVNRLTGTEADPDDAEIALKVNSEELEIIKAYREADDEHKKLVKIIIRER